jgi:metal-sulfur cluster biosynthetic enzyme
MTNLEDKVRNSLKKVLDPELRINIVDLGLVYDVREEGGEVEVEMTLTSPGCPLAGVIDERIREVVGKVRGVKKITIEIIWDPPWTEEMMSDEAKAELGFD